MNRIVEDLKRAMRELEEDEEKFENDWAVQKLNEEIKNEYRDTDNVHNILHPSRFLGETR